MISIILTAYKEKNTVGQAIESLISADYSGYHGKIELLQISPDEDTLKAGSQAYNAIKPANANFRQIVDPGKGKPTALNLGIKAAKGEIVIFTDGDVYFEKRAVNAIIEKFKKSEKIGAVTGRPVSIDSKCNMMGYFGHLLADGNHYRREIDLAHANLEKGKILVKRHKFAPMSGYIMAVRKELLDFELPEDVFVDDAYISYMVFNKGVEVAYEPSAMCFIRYPKTLSDYFKQKKRSVGGYIQLWKYGIVKKETKSRSFWHELEMIWFPFKYAKSFKQFIWSCFLLPIRLWLWLQIFYEQRILHKDFDKVWVRVESTK